MMYSAYWPSNDSGLIMNMLSRIPLQDSANADKHWRALFKGNFYAREISQGHVHTCMGKTQHYGPLRVQRPFYPEGNELLHLYLLHPPGGLVGGDELSIDITARDGAKVLVTTPSAGKLYRNETDMQQGQHVSIKVNAGSVVEYLPQENIIFNGAKGTLNTLVELKGDGLFIGWEITCLGRPEGQQYFEHGTLSQNLIIKKEDKPLFIDRLQLDANDGLMQSPVGLQGHTTFATFVINREIGSETYTQLIDLQQSHNYPTSVAYMGVTQKKDVFIVRVLGDRAEPVRQLLEKVWEIVRPDVYGREFCIPRIWNT